MYTYQHTLALHDALPIYLGTGGLGRFERCVRIRLGSRAVVVDSDSLRTVFREITRDQPTKILRTARDENGFACDAVVGHVSASFVRCGQTRDRFRPRSIPSNVAP